MPRDHGHLVLSLFLPGPGHHLAAWRHPDAVVGDAINFDFLRGVAQAAEREVYDMLFLADALALPVLQEDRYPLHFPPFEPLTLLAALSAVTTRIGLAGSLSTTYFDPFSVARSFASLDHLSGGRAGWNVVTSMFDTEARNFGAERHLPHGDRYRRAGVFVDLVKDLRDSWEDGALIADKDGGRAVDIAKVHRVEHDSGFFSVAGPLSLPRPPQGHPLIVQAGASDDGQDLSAAVADAVFTTQPDKQSAKVFYRGLKERARRHGRNPDHLVVLPGLMAIVGRTSEEARAKFESLQRLIDPASILSVLSLVMGEVDFTGIDLDGPLPPLPEAGTSKSRAALFHAMARAEQLSVRELCKRVAVARGHLLLVGSAKEVADELQAWYEEDAADGFNLLPAMMPDSFNDFNALVLPILRERGLAETRYSGRTLRDHLRLPRPTRHDKGHRAP